MTFTGIVIPDNNREESPSNGKPDRPETDPTLATRQAGSLSYTLGFSSTALSAELSVKSSRSGVINVQPFSIAQRSVPTSAFCNGITVNQKYSRPRGSFPGIILPS